MYTEYHILFHCKILIIEYNSEVNYCGYLENNGIVSLSGCSCWLAKGDGAVGKDGALSSCVHSSIVLSSRLLTYSVKMSAIVNKSISFELTICFCYWHYFRSKFPLFLFGKHNFHSFSSQFGNCLGSSEVFIEMHCSQQ